MRTPRRTPRSLFGFSAALLVLALALTACGDDTQAVDAGSGDNAGADGNTRDTTDPDTGASEPGNPGGGIPADECPATNPDCGDTGVTVPVGEPRPIEPNPDGTTDPRPNAFDDYAVSDDGTTLTLSFYMGVDSCYSLDHVQVDETDTSVTVTIFTGGNPDLDPDTACIEIAELRSTTVELAAPLGDREVVDGSI
jgi:hypothetical protein